MHKEITPSEFFEECKRILGPVTFSHLFPGHVTQYVSYMPSPRDPLQYQRYGMEPKLDGEEQRPKEIKTERLHDIIEYAGVDLKEEQENIGKEGIADMELTIGEEDKKDSVNYLFDIEMLVQYVNFIAGKRGMKIDNSVYHALFLSLKRKLSDMIEKMVQACEFRVDYIKSNVVTKIENDIRRQLWVLEEQEKKELSKMFSKKSSDDDDDAQKKKLKKNVQEREDLIIKKRLSNTVALAALGIQRKSWMNSDDTVGKQEKKTPFQSLYSPYNEKEMERKIINRKIIMDDFIYVLERDKRYNKSVFTIKEYFRK